MPAPPPDRPASGTADYAAITTMLDGVDLFADSMRSGDAVAGGAKGTDN